MGEGATGGDRRGRQRLTVPEAATVLGVTVDAVRGRIRWGKLASEHDENGTVYVWIDAPEANGPGQSPTVEGPEEASQGPSAEREELVESLLDQVKYMREQLAAEREANRENRRLLAAALERIPALERQSREAPRRLAMRIPCWYRRTPGPGGGILAPLVEVLELTPQPLRGCIPRRRMCSSTLSGGLSRSTMVLRAHLPARGQRQAAASALERRIAPSAPPSSHRHNG